MIDVVSDRDELIRKLECNGPGPRRPEGWRRIGIEGKASALDQLVGDQQLILRILRTLGRWEQVIEGTEADPQ
jgi:hypothetical protein